MEKTIYDLDLYEEKVAIAPGSAGGVAKNLTVTRIEGGFLYTTRTVVIRGESIACSESSVFVPYQEPQEGKKNADGGWM